MQKRIYVVLLSIFMAAEMVVSTGATTLSNAKLQHQKTQNSLNNMESQVETLTTEKAEADEKLERLQTQLVDILTSITICEDEIEMKKMEIDSARDELIEVEHLEEEQYTNMKRRVKFMYEQGEKAYIQILLECSGYTEMVNKADYVEKLYAYDKQLLAGYVESKEKVTELKATLEDEEADLESANRELEEEQGALEALVQEQKDLVADFDTQLANARTKVANYKIQLEEETKQLQVLEKQEQQRLMLEAAQRKKEAEERKKRLEEQQTNAENETADGESSIDTSDGSIEDDSSNSDSFSAGAGDSLDTPSAPSSGLGQQVVNYACQFVGNPYVYGGTSLTNGTDCSGFTMSVYQHFGISIPRDSTSQRSCGIGVDLASAQPGDLICYAGHVALYMGGGMIVHASTERTGITYSPANYRTILAVRRVIY